MVCRQVIFYFFVIILINQAQAQGYQAPETRMPHNLVKDFIHMHMVYPHEAINNGEEGVFLIDFYVDESGSVSDKKIKKSVSELVDSAAMNLFNLVLWKPATYLGKPVGGNQEFKIKYNIKRFSSLASKRGYKELPSPHLPLSTSRNIFTVKELDKAPKAMLNEQFKSVQDFIVQNLELPEAAIKLNLNGVVKIRFVIETSGLPSNIMVIEPLGGGCTEEAIRLVQMIHWYPGIKHQEAVRTCYNISITFDPADEIKSKHIPNQSNTGI